MRISWKQRRTRGLGLVIFLALLLGIASARAARNDSSSTKTILVFGDSLSDGLALSRGQAYPALLVPKLKAAGLSCEVINASQSGGTTEDGLARLPPHLRQSIDIFVLELGINDAFRGTPIEKIRDNLQSLIETVRAKNPEVHVVVVGMQWPNHSGDDYVDAFGRMYVDLARKNHAALVPYLLEGVSGHPDLNLPDGLHPNPAGHRILADNVWRVLEPVAREVAGRPGASIGR
jgi:acyl-CoA thioesterase-1